MSINPCCTLVAVKHTEVVQRANLAVRGVEVGADAHLGRRRRLWIADPALPSRVPTACSRWTTSLSSPL